MTAPAPLAALRQAAWQLLWRARLRLGATGLVALAVAAAATAGAAALALQAPERDQALAQARQRLAAARQAAPATPPLAAPPRVLPPRVAATAQPPASAGMKLDPGAGDEFIDPAPRPASAPAAPATVARTEPAPEPAQALLDELPALAQRDDDLATLQTLAREAGLPAARTQYRLLEARSGRIARLELVLSDTQGFETWRTLMVNILNRLPHAAVTGLSVTRAPNDGGAAVARLTVVLHHRASPAAP